MKNKQKIMLAALAVALLGAAAFAVYHFSRDEEIDWTANQYALRNTSISARIGAYAPYAFLNKDGALDGYVIDLTNAISRVMNVRIVMLSKKMDESQDYEALKDADVVLCMIKNPQAALHYDFTRPYAVHSFGVFGRHGTAGPVNFRNIQNNPAYVINTDGVYYDLHFDSSLPVNCGLASSAEEAMRLIESGQFDYTIQETYIGRRVIVEQRLLNLDLLANTGESIEYCFAVQKNNPDLLRIFNDGLNHLTSTGQFDNIQKRWLDQRFLVTKTTRDSIITYVALGVGIILLAIIVALVWSFTLKRQVRERTAALESEVEERRKTEARLLDSQAQLIQADKLAAIGTLASGVAHEINNPNGQVMLNVEFMKRILSELYPGLDERYQSEGDFRLAGMPWSKLRERFTTLTDDTVQASMRIKAIVDDIKSFARIESDEENAAFSLNKAVEDSLRLLHSLLSKKTRRLSVDLAPDLPLVYGRAQKIEQVVINIVINACEALPDPDRGLAIRTDFEAASSMVRLLVADEGVGIPPERLGNVLDPFYTSKREQGGTGLGLSISNTIVAAHQGSLEIESEVRKGTTVIVRLPAYRAANDQEAP